MITRWVSSITRNLIDDIGDSMSDFVFDKISDSDIEKYAEEAKVFNYTRERIDREGVMLVSFEDEKLGSSMEKLDLAVSFDKKVWTLLDIDDIIQGYNEIPLGYVTNGVEYNYLMVIVRLMSNMVLDKVHDNYHAYIYCRVDDYLKGIEDSYFQGKLAVDKFDLLGDYDTVIKKIEGSELPYRKDLLREIKRLKKENTKMDRKLSELELMALDNIGKNVRFVRRELLGVTLEGLAKSTGVSRDVICRLEALSDVEDSLRAGDKVVYPSISTVIKFCDGVGIKPSQLLETQIEYDEGVISIIKEHCKDFMKAKNK